MSDSFLEPEEGKEEDEHLADDVADDEAAEAVERDGDDPGIQGPEAPGLSAPD